MIILRGCRLIGIVCVVSMLELIKRPISPKKQRAKAQKEMQKTLGYLYQGSLQVN
jgi:hypothetical protein